MDAQAEARVYSPKRSRPFLREKLQSLSRSERNQLLLRNKRSSNRIPAEEQLVSEGKANESHYFLNANSRKICCDEYEKKVRNEKDTIKTSTMSSDLNNIVPLNGAKTKVSSYLRPKKVEPTSAEQQGVDKMETVRVEESAPSEPARQASDFNTNTRKSSFEEKDKMVPKKMTNRVMLHVYDLIANDTLILLPPFGCVVEIGQCFTNMNSALHTLGTGAYHVGVEINGVEYAYGATSKPGKTGIFSCFPKMSPGYQFRTTIDFGERPAVTRTLPRVDKEGRRSIEEVVMNSSEILREMAREYMGSDYDILRKNCCSFACDVCRRHGVLEQEIPSWFRNLAESGAATQDAANAAIQPIASFAGAISNYDDSSYSS